MKGRFAPFAIAVIAVSLAGSAIRWSVEPAANSSDRAALLSAERQAAERSTPLAYLALAGAGLALLLSDRPSTRAAGGLLVIASGLLANLPGVLWLSGLLVGVPMLLAASIWGRFGGPEDRA